MQDEVTIPETASGALEPKIQNTNTHLVEIASSLSLLSARNPNLLFPASDPYNRVERERSVSVPKITQDEGASSFLIPFACWERRKRLFVGTREGLWAKGASGPSFERERRKERKRGRQKTGMATKGRRKELAAAEWLMRYLKCSLNFALILPFLSCFFPLLPHFPVVISVTLKAFLSLLLTVRYSPKGLLKEIFSRTLLPRLP
ncbi:hypothetical protein LIA77_00238 [Sarocladium implicatum]|nr:hypothetical protein LIA77_00238 [Sarocladium implicatum]